MNYWLTLYNSELYNLIKEIQKIQLKPIIKIIKFTPLPNLFEEKLSIENKEIFGLAPKLNKIKCKYCGKCLDYCVNNAISFVREIPRIGFDMQKCNLCENCLNKCSVSAIMLINKVIGYLKIDNLSDKLLVIEAIKKYKRYPNKNYLDVLKNFINNDGIYLIIHSGLKCSEIIEITKNKEADFIVVSNIDKNHINQIYSDKFEELDLNKILSLYK